VDRAGSNLKKTRIKGEDEVFSEIQRNKARASAASKAKGLDLRRNYLGPKGREEILY